MKHKVRFAAVLCAVCLAFSGCSAQTTAASQAEPTATPLPTPTPVPVKTVTFSASGDNLIHGSIYLQARTAEGYDFTPLYENIADFYKNYDLNFINQETLVNDQLAPSHYPCFSTPGELGREAYEVGWRLFGGSNNHSYDKGAAGVAATREFWDGMPEDALHFGFYTDEDEMTIPLYEENGITFACLAYTEHTNGIPTPAGAEAHVIYTSETEKIEQQIRLARQQADVVLVSVHWGVENSHTVTDAQRQLGQKMADWGADLIIGTHPHVIQSTEWLTAEDGREVFCIYSLGNFVSAQSQPDQLFGYVFTCTFTQEGDEACTIDDVVLYPTVTHYGYNYSNIRAYFLSDYTPELMASHGARATYPYFDLEYINETFAELIDPALLPAA